MENGPAYEGNPFINLDNMDDIDYAFKSSKIKTNNVKGMFE